MIKNFKPPFSDNPDTYTDYLNEVTVLSVLDRYRDKLPFEIPKQDEMNRLPRALVQTQSV